MSARQFRHARTGVVSVAALALLGAAAQPMIPWDDLVESDWLYSLATRFALVDAHRVHYKTPTAELAGLLAARPEPDALRHLAQAQMDLGQRDKALATMETWAASQAAGVDGDEGAGWDAAARWAWSYGAHEAAFRFADKAVPGLEGEAQRALADLRVAWAQEQPTLRDRRAMQRAALELNAADWATAYSWVDADIASGNLVAAEQGLATLPKATPEEPALVLKARLRIAQRRAAEVLPDLEAALQTSPRRGRLFAVAYVAALDQAARSQPDEWRRTLDARFDAPALARLFTYFKGQDRGDACLSLLQQIDRRHQKTLDRAGWALVSMLYAEIDAVPEAFRARLAAATFADGRTAETDLAELTRLALRAGGRPLAWGSYSDADYRWVARMDPTPGFWTGGLSVLLTGQDWNEALARLEAESIPERTFGAARALLAELTKRNPSFPGIPGLKVDVMQRHVDRGEGRETLALLREVETAGSPAERQRAQALGLLALRQTKAPIAEEVRLYKARLRLLAADGSAPRVEDDTGFEPERRFQPGDFAGPGDDPTDGAPGARTYRALLDEAIGRLEERDKTHRTSLGLILGELDRMPGAEALWLNLATRLDGWNLDDELGPRYEAALARFDDASWWNRLARFLTRKKRQSEVRGLAERIAETFRGSAMFERANNPNIRIEIPEQPKVGARVRLVPWGDWVVLKALERFPHSPEVLKAAESRLVTATAWRAMSARATDPKQAVVVEDSLLAERRWAVFAADASVREDYFAGLMKSGALDTKLAELDRAAERTPVEDLILSEGYARLSLFEKAADATSRLSAAYPGDDALALRALQVRRSLAGLDLSHEAAAKAVVDRSAPALADPNPLITELGELYEETGRPAQALDAWKALLDRDPRKEDRIRETATLLWDYGHMKEALDTIEAARVRMGKPHLLAFETGVLREEVKDLDGAIREYLNAVLPDDTGDACYCSGFESDQRSLRRLAQWMGRDRVRNRILASIDALKPGNADDEKTLLAFWPLGSIVTPNPGLDWDADSWIDGMDQPNDPMGREDREAKRLAARGREHAGIETVAKALVARAAALTPAATSGRFLSALESAAQYYTAAAWGASDGRDRFLTALVARQAELAPTIEERLALEVDLAQRLAKAGRTAEAEALWTAMIPRIESLPQGVAKIKTEVARAAFIETTGGFDKARASWDALVAKYPWSLGVIEDRVAFLGRNGRGDAARQALEDATARAAEGHLVPLLTRVVSESLAAKDAARASRAVDRLLAIPTLSDEERLGAVALQARLRLQKDAAFGAVAFATTESAKFKPELRARVFAEVARAAAAEKAWDPAVSAWIEALNRSTQRDWLSEAAMAARRTGKPETLLAFFEAQQQRSPRDVRWAVVVRDLRVATDNLAGGIAMARTAVAIRPERGSLWDEAVDLMERDERYAEAADFLEGWNRQRPDDPNVAGRRSDLYIRAGDTRKALAVERAALAAAGKTLGEEDLAARAADAARRLWRQGQPQLAWRFLSPQGDLEGIEGASLTTEEKFQLAILNNAFLPLLSLDAVDADRRGAAATVLGQYGRIENREQMLGWLIERIFPTARADEGFLNAWWPFIDTSRLEVALRFRLAQRFVRQTPGPWAAEPAVDLLEAAGDSVITSVATQDGGSEFKVKTPDLDALWVAHLVRYDRADDLARYLQPRLAALIETVRGPAALNADSKRVPWTAWLDDPAAMQAFARGLRAQPALVASLSSIFEDRRLWDRLWAIGARGWNVSPLLAEASPASRVAWMSLWERPVRVAGAAADDPTLVSRRAAFNTTLAALGQLLGETGAPASGAAGASPVAQRLLGPALLGDVLGRDAKFTWALFRPRTNAAGEVLEAGDDRIVGRGIDTLRFPGSFWGERPGLAWYALQAYARYRAGDASAIDVPAEWTEAGSETERTLLAARLALALKGPAEALAQLDRLAGARAGDPEMLRFRYRLLFAAGRTADASADLKRRVLAGQKQMAEETLRAFEALAEEFGLAAPVTLLDPATPLSPALLASIYARQGSDVGRRFRTDDPTGFRAALATRWSDKAAILEATELRVWLSELWATDAAVLPVAGLDGLGDFWPHAAAWAQSVPATDRARVLAAVDALPDRTRLDAIPEGVGDPRARRALAIRAQLARGEDDAAAATFRAGLAALADAEPPVFHPIALHKGEDAAAADVPDAPTGWGGGWDPSAVEPAPEITALRALRAPFVAAKKDALVRGDVLAWLDDRAQRDPSSLDVWSMRLELAEPPARAAVVEALGRAYRRGDIATGRAGEIADLLVRQAKDHAGPWVRRAPVYWAFATVLRRAESLAAVGAPLEAAASLHEARGRLLFERAEEIRAFDAWRRVATADAPGPDAWKQAVAAWRGAPEASATATALEARLREHPLDVLSARAALRTPASLAAAPALLAIRALHDLDDLGFLDVNADDALLRLRAARSMLGTPSAVRSALGALSPDALEADMTRRRFRAADIDAALADVARLGAASGDPTVSQDALARLADRGATGLRALRVEIAAAIPVSRPLVTHRLVANRPALFRPRDLTFAIVSRLVEADLASRVSSPPPPRTPPPAAANSRGGAR